MPRQVFLAALMAFAILLSNQLFAQQTSPPMGGDASTSSSRVLSSSFTANTVQVVVLKSWGQTSIWDAMSTNWQNFGSVPVAVDDSTYVNSDFTYQDLVTTGANVIVLSDPAGGERQYSQEEIAAVAKYAQDGHTVVGTFVVFQWLNTDNRGLAPIFGLNSETDFNTSQVGISNIFQKTEQGACLLNGIAGDSWQSQGFPYAQVPTSGNWVGHRGKAVGLAKSENWAGVVGTFTAPAYTAVYVSNFPEYNGGTDDEQLLYNAVTCYVP